ncbi:MAG: CcmD family protein [Candidatus Latescibacteria bacterium]|nr:CcmD family protein [Candidatus Latescibacterota bacterium]
MDNLSHLFAAYAVIWIVLAGYVVRLTIKEKRLWKEIRVLKEAIGKKEP